MSFCSLKTLAVPPRLFPFVTKFPTKTLLSAKTANCSKEGSEVGESEQNSRWRQNWHFRDRLKLAIWNVGVCTFLWTPPGLAWQSSRGYLYKSSHTVPRHFLAEVGRAHGALGSPLPEGMWAANDCWALGGLSWDGAANRPAPVSQIQLPASSG